MFGLEPPQRRLFWVVFSDRSSMEAHWWHRFLSPGFYHVWLFTRGKAGSVALDPLHHTWALEWVPADPEQVAAELVSSGRHRVLVIDRPSKARYYNTAFMSCVSVVKSCLGVKSRAWTPRQLYHELLQMGAVEVGN